MEMEAMMGLQIKRSMTRFTGVHSVAEAAEKTHTSVQATDLAKYSLELETRDNVEVLRSDCVMTMEINGHPVQMHSRGLFRVTSDTIYDVVIGCPASMDAEVTPFAEWVLKHVKVK